MTKIVSCPDEHSFKENNFNYNNLNYSLRRCSVCGFIETEPENTFFEDIYDSGHYEVKGFKLIPFLINLPDYLYFIFIMKRNNVYKNSYILDFGCGKGFFLFLLKLFRFNNLNGVETSKPRALFSEKLLGFSISEDYYHGGKIMDKTFDFISLIHVLEHIKNPFVFLDNLIKGALNTSGSIFIEIPNIDSLSYSIAGKYWAHFTPHFHTNHFTILSLEKYCEDRGLNYKIVGTFSFYNSAMGMTSAFLSKFGYVGSIFEDLKKKNLIVALLFILCIPISLITELFVSFFLKKGSVIKILIYK